MRGEFNILLAGVAGQGGIVATRILGEAAISSSLRPTVGETFGASRRGGTVYTHLRLVPGDAEDPSPLIPQGQVGVLIGLEPVEALRASIDYGGKKTTAFVSNIQIQTPDTLSGRVTYPDIRRVMNHISGICGTAHEIHPRQLEKEGRIRRLNVFMVGAVAGTEILPMNVGTIREKVESLEDTLKGNLIAFEQGVRYARLIKKR